MEAEFERRVPEILIVDDTPANLQVLAELLKDCGWKPRPISSGLAAIEAAKLAPPDIILLDINMPEIDGYEVCRRLKVDPELKDIPVIFISAMSETIDKVRAFGTGGVDYISKPFQFEEVEARIRTHLELCRQRHMLSDSLKKLRELEIMRDDLTHMIVHDMRSPLAAIAGYTELLMMNCPPEIQAESMSDLQKIKSESNLLIEMCSSILDVSRMESGQMKVDPLQYPVRKIVESAVAKLGSLLERKVLLLELPEEPAYLVCDQQLLIRILQNLLGNAIKYTKTNGEIVITAEPIEGGFRFAVKDNGMGIPEEYRGLIFEKFGQVTLRQYRRKYSTGLGLTFCKMAVEAHGGKIGVNARETGGSEFWFTIPQPLPSV